MVRSLVLLIFSLLVITFDTYSQPGTGYKPIVLDTSYHHTQYETTPSDLTYNFAAFSCSFDSDDDNDGDGKNDIWGIPEWVSYEIKAIPNQTQSGSRPSKWLTDTQRNAQGIVPDDDTYAVSKVSELPEVKLDYRYVRGHLCMKSIASRVSLDAEYNTHTTLNAVPQLQWQNRGIWLDLEDKTVKWAENNGSVWVICGPVFFGKKPAVWLGQDDEVKAAVPDALYKVVIRIKDNKPQALAFIIPNIIPTDRNDFTEFLTSINRVEQLTGLNFMSNVPDNEQMESLNENLTLEQKKAVISEW